MNSTLWVIHKSTGLSEAVMLRINQYLGFMPLRSTHDCLLFRELVNRRSIAQERVAKWFRRSIKTIDPSQGITTCLKYLANVTCDLDGKPHEHNCDHTRQKLQNKYRSLTQLYDCARVPTEEGSDERRDQERRVLHCPVCNQNHFHPAMCKDATEDIKDGFLDSTIRDGFVRELCCGIEERKTNVPNLLHWIQGKGYSFPVEDFHRKSA